MLSVFMLSVLILSVVAPFSMVYQSKKSNYDPVSKLKAFKCLAYHCQSGNN
jgi:hypothetical protein